MSNPGVPEDDLLVQSRSALLDALDALADQRDAVIVVGAQAIYLQTISAPVALAESTKDSDLAFDTRILSDSPLVEEAMKEAGFLLDPTKGQPGAWVNRAGIPVDLMVPEALAGVGGSRSARIPPHAKSSMRRAKGLEAAVVDNHTMIVGALSASDSREYTVKVAGLAALIVAKTHKIAERVDAHRQVDDKDAHDIYRILVATETAALASSFEVLRNDPLSGAVTNEALGFLSDLFAKGPDALGSMMAGRAEEGIGEVETVALSTSILAADLLKALPGQ